VKLFAKGKVEKGAQQPAAPAFSPIDRVGMLGLLDQVVNGSQTGVLELHEPQGNWVYAFQAGALTHASGGRVRGARQAFDLLWEFQSGECAFRPGADPNLAGNLYIDKARLQDLLRRSQAALQGPSAPYIPPGQQRPIAPATWQPPAAAPAWGAGGYAPQPGYPQPQQPGYPPQPPLQPQQGYPQPQQPVYPQPQQPGYPPPQPQAYPQPPPQGYPQPQQPGYAQQPPPGYPPAPFPAAPYPGVPPQGQPYPQPPYPAYPQAPPQPVPPQAMPQQSMPPQQPLAAQPPVAPHAPRPVTPPSFSVPPMAIPKKREAPLPAYQPAVAAPMPAAPEPPKPSAPKDDLAALRASLVAQAPPAAHAPSGPAWGVRGGEPAAPPVVPARKGAGKGKGKDKAPKVAVVQGKAAPKPDSKLKAAVKIQLIKFLLWACERRYSPDDHWTLKDAFEISTMELRDQFFSAFSQSLKASKKTREDNFDDTDDMAAGRMRGRGRRH